MLISKQKLELSINNKYPRVKLTRVIRCNWKVLKIDPRTYILDKHNVILEDISKKNRLKVPLNNDKTVANCMEWVQKNTKYKLDRENWVHVDNWQDPQITAQIKTWDCEDLSLLLISLAIASWVPYYRLKLCIWSWSKESKGSHAFVLFLNKNNEWEMWDAIKKTWANRGLASKLVWPTGSFYKYIWLTCNKKYIFDQHEIKKDDTY